MNAQQYLDPPLTGGRVELRRDEPDARRDCLAVYVARWSTPDGVWEGELIVMSDGQVQPRFAGEPAPSWLADFSVQLLRTIARAATRDAEGASWPRRLTRWRAAPEPR